MLNCLLIKKKKKKERYSEMDLFHGMVIFHQDDLERYVSLPVLHQMMLIVNLPLGHFPPF